MPEILLTCRFLEAGIDCLRRRGLEFDLVDPITRADLLAATQRYRIIMGTITHRFDADFFAAARGGPLRLLAQYGAGIDNIDLAAATAAGVLVTNTPDVLTEATAELAWALAFAAARRVVEGHNLLVRGSWRGWAPDFLVGRSVTGSVVGVIGAGRIGQAFVRMGRGFGCRFLYFNRSRKPEFERETGAAYRELDDLLRESDIVSIHLPGGEGTKRLLDAHRLGLMKPTAVLVNTGRGQIIDEAALAQALREHRLAAAGLDVYEKEPQAHPDLLALPNAVLAPHIGSATFRCRTAAADRCGENVEMFLKGMRPRDALNRV